MRVVVDKSFKYLRGVYVDIVPESKFASEWGYDMKNLILCKLVDKRNGGCFLKNKLSEMKWDGLSGCYQFIDYNKNGVSVPIDLVDSPELEWEFMLPELENHMKVEVYPKYSHAAFAIKANNCFPEFDGQTYLE